MINVNTAPNGQASKAGKRLIMRQTAIALAIASATWLLQACQAGEDSSAAEPEQALPEGLVHCPSQRPEVCTQQYDPVCGFAKPGIPLGDGQSSGLEWATGDAVQPNPHRTFGNACSACARPEVAGYLPGPCPE